MAPTHGILFHVCAYSLLRFFALYILHERNKNKKDIESYIYDVQMSSIPPCMHMVFDTTNEDSNVQKKNIVTRKRQAGKRQKNFCCDAEKRTKLRPNYFVAFKVSNPEIHQLLGIVQDHIIRQDKGFQKCIVPLPTLHVTLAVMYIANDAELLRASDTLENICNKYKDGMSANPVMLEFKGLSHFGNKVLFADVSENIDSLERLNNLTNDIKASFLKESIHVIDQHRAFNPHLTVLKLSNDPHLFKKGIRKIPPTLYALYKNQLFGTQIVKGLQLLKMSGPKDETGYYQGQDLLFDVP